MVNAGWKIGEILCDQVKIDVIESAGVRVGAEIDCIVGIAFLLGNVGGQEKNLRKCRKIWGILTCIVVWNLVDRFRYCF